MIICFESKKILNNLFVKYTDLQSQFRSSNYPFSGGCWQETEKFRVNVYFETSEHSVQTADDNSKLTSKALQTTMQYGFYRYALLADLL